MRHGSSERGRTLGVVVGIALLSASLTVGVALDPFIGMAAEAPQRLPDLSTWAKCGETLRPIPHRRFHQRDRTTYFLASAWYEDELSVAPSVAAIVRLTVTPGTRSPSTASKVEADLHTYKMTGAAPALVAAERLKETAAAQPIWSENSGLAWALLDLLVGRGVTYDTARASIPAYRFMSSVTDNRLDAAFTLLGNSKGPGAPASEVLVKDAESQVHVVLSCLL